MKHQMRSGVLAVTLALALGASSAWACGDPAGMTHVGVVASLDPSSHSLVLVDAQTGRNIAFEITPQQAKAVQSKDRVVIQYSEHGDVLVVEDIAKG